MAIYGKKKHLKNILQNLENFKAESFYIASVTQGLPDLLRWWS